MITSGPIFFTRDHRIAFIAGSLVLLAVCTSGAIGQTPELAVSGGMCQEPANQSRELKLRQSLPSLVAGSSRDDGIPPLLLRPPEDGATAAAPSSAAAGISLSDDVTAVVRYKRARAFATSSGDELRLGNHGGLANTSDRDVLGLGMNWGVGERSSVGVGYQLHSTRPDSSGPGGNGESSSILPGSDRVDHAVTFGVSRSWGGAD